jgi:hypothetical protein
VLKSKTLVAAIAAIVVLAPRVCAEDANPRKALESAYTEYDKAAKQGVPGVHKWCETNLAPDFTMAFQDGNALNRDQYLEMMQRLIANPAPAWKDVKSQKSRIKKVEPQGTDFVVTVDISTTYLTKNPKRKEITLERPYRETWAKVGDAWKVRRCEELAPKPVVAKTDQGKPKRPDFPNPRNGSPNANIPIRRPGYP